jgi:hypothetical protein
MRVCDSVVDFSLYSPEDGVIKLHRNLAPTLQPARPDVAEETLTSRKFCLIFPIPMPLVSLQATPAALDVE